MPKVVAEEIASISTWLVSGDALEDIEAAADLTKSLKKGKKPWAR